MCVYVLNYIVGFTFRFTGSASTAITLQLNFNPACKVSEEGTINFGAVFDDQGYPFLGLQLSYFDEIDKWMNKIELVAKRTDGLKPS